MLPNYQDQNSPRLTSGEKAVLYCAAAFYTILAVIIAFQTSRLIYIGAFAFRNATNLLWILYLILASQRAIYFYLVPAGVLGLEGELELVDFFMIDFPLVLYLIGNLVIAFSFLFLFLRQKSDEARKPVYFWGLLILSSFLVVMVFVSALLAFRYQALDSFDEGPILCPYESTNSNDATRIRIIYESILITLSTITAATELVLGIVIWAKIRDSYGSNLILWVAAVASLGMISDSIAFLVYYIVNDPTPYFVIVLMFTEILPMSFIIISLSSSQIKAHSLNSSASGGFGSR